jgi:hypothetical protein
LVISGGSSANPVIRQIAAVSLRSSEVPC